MSTRAVHKSMPQFDIEAAKKMGEAVGGLAAFIVQINTLREYVVALEARVSELEAQARSNAPAMQAAWMNVPIGGKP